LKIFGDIFASGIQHAGWKKKYARPFNTQSIVSPKLVRGSVGIYSPYII